MKKPPAYSRMIKTSGIETGTFEEEAFHENF
jgi:hypothetical protein